MNPENRLKRTLIGFGVLFALGIGAYIAYSHVIEGVEAEMRDREEPPDGRKPFQTIRDRIQSASDRTMGDDEFWKDVKK